MVMLLVRLGMLATMVVMLIADVSHLPLMTRLLSRVVPGFVLQFGISGYCLFLHLSFD